jgi:hypothetical protein
VSLFNTTNEKEWRIHKIKDVIDMNHERLQRIFVYYCSFGEPLNTNSLRSTKFIKLLRDANLVQGGEEVNKSKTNTSKTRARSNMSNQRKPDTLTITMVQADLLFKKHTGLSKKTTISRSNSRNVIASSFTSDSKKKQEQKERVQGLNRMDFDTFVLVLSDIANQVYAKYLDDVDETAFRGEAQALMTLINRNLLQLDNSI